MFHDANPLNVLFTRMGGGHTSACPGSYTSSVAAQRSDIDRWFIRRGLPHFIEPYSAGPAVWNRAAPVLVVAYVAGGFNGLDLHNWSVARNLAAAAVVIAVLMITWMAANLFRRRPALSRPKDLGTAELIVFVVGPTIPSLVFEQWDDVALTAIEGVTVLTVIYFVTSYGVVPLMAWAASQTFHRVGSVGRMLTRALPLLLLFTVFLFINAEVWQVAGTLTGVAYALTLALFFVMGSAFVLSRVPAVTHTVSQFDDWGEVTTLLSDTPASDLAAHLPAHGDPMERSLSMRQRVNIGLVSVFSQAMLITMVAVSLAVFLALFGLFTMTEQHTAAWTGLDSVHVLWRVHLDGRELVVTEPLLRVTGFLGAFSGMYFTVVLGTDATYRDEFAEDAGPQIRQALAVRLARHHATHQR